jgi:hypothetical protein
MNIKRVIICTIGGMIAAAICLGGMAASGRVELTAIIVATGIGNRILIGFVIGISGWRINYLLHGALIGLLVTLSSSVGIIFSNMQGFIMYTIAGIIYGILIEFFATRVFKAPMA